MVATGDLHAAGIGLVDPGEHLDRRALARAVAPEQRVHGARPHGQRGVVEGQGRAEALGDPRHGERRDAPRDG